MEGARQEENNRTDVEPIRELDEAPSATAADRTEDLLPPEAMDEHILPTYGLSNHCRWHT